MGARCRAQTMTLVQPHAVLMVAAERSNIATSLLAAVVRVALPVLTYAWRAVQHISRLPRWRMKQTRTACLAPARALMRAAQSARLACGSIAPSRMKEIMVALTGTVSRLRILTKPTWKPTRFKSAKLSALPHHPVLALRLAARESPEAQTVASIRIFAPRMQIPTGISFRSCGMQPVRQ